MSINEIVIKGGKENNLKNINLTIPKNKLIVFTGVSGSGKSTLAFDTIFAEGQRRFVESLSSYARQFLGNFEKANVDSISGLSPAIAIEQKTQSHNPRSTVGTVTEIYDYLRLLYAKIGIPYCPKHNKPIISFSVQKITDIVLKDFNNKKLIILAPIKKDNINLKKEIQSVQSNGFVRVRINDKILNIDEITNYNYKNIDNFDIVIDRVFVTNDNKSRIFDDIELSTKYGDGIVCLLIDDKEFKYSIKNKCTECGYQIPNLEPRFFSFNSPLGACSSCNGLGFNLEASLDLLVPDQTLSINQGAIIYYKNSIGSQNLEWMEFDYLLSYYNINKDIPFNKLSEKEKSIILNGSPDIIEYKLTSSSGNTLHRKRNIEGVKTHVERLYNETQSDFLRQYYYKFLRNKVCSKCHGSRLSDEVLCVKINGLNIHELTCLTLDNFYKFICDLDNKLSDYEKAVSDLIVKEIKNRTEFLINVGLSYLTLTRYAMTLSGGESQRIRLATQIGSKLSGVLYVLDEPSIGLHQRDSWKLINTLKEMRDLGNTIIVVEHDEEMIVSADYIVDIGPGAGDYGGEVVAQGNLETIKKSKKSITGQYLTREKYIPVPYTRNKGNGKFIKLYNCHTNNLKNINVSFPLGCFICVTGVSGSGKSSLVNGTLLQAINKELLHKNIEQGLYSKIEGLENIDNVINISQEPIGKTPRSNPATYVKAFDDIRDIFAETIEAKTRGYNKSRFSFNLSGGRCENCNGDGVIKISMNFLPDVYVKCHECNGKRYNEETLQVTYRNKTISDVLDMRIEEAYNFFKDHHKLAKKLKYLVDVGLGYMKVGQQSNTISGGEAQRVKLSSYLQKKPTGKTIYILDEPTTGLHTDDIARLLSILEKIVLGGDTIICIEHNLDLIKVADYIIDIGPEGGDRGGQIVAQGTPEEVSNNDSSYTGKYLKKILEEDKNRKDKIKNEL
ncbi:MAG: excinuclease ABC subunit UvrA [Bacillales bacterium]